MNNQTHAFRAIHRPGDVQNSFSLLVVDGTGRPHLPLTTFYHQLQRQLSDGTARSYLNSILPFFSFLASDEWRQRRKDQWNSPPDAVQESVRDYLMHRLKCKVQPKSTSVFVKLTAQSPTTVRLFLAALKQFYAIMSSEGYYPYLNPLLDATSRVLREVEQEERAQRHRMPQCSGVEEPLASYPSENFFRVAHMDWEVHPVDDPTLGKKLIEGFAQAGLSLRDQIVIRMALETGARIREILTLTIGDWRTRGSSQEAKTWSKGSRGRRVKTIRFSSMTAKMLRQYLNTDRAKLDPTVRRFEQLSDSDPLFVSQRKHPYDYEAFKPHWYKLCQLLQLDLNIHALRHWYTTQAIRLIAETAKSSAEIVLRKEALVRYMAWRTPDTLFTYERYFKGVQHYAIQDHLHQRLERGVRQYAKRENKRGDDVPRDLPKPHTPAARSDHSLDGETIEASETHGWTTLLALGGGQAHG